MQSRPSLMNEYNQLSHAISKHSASDLTLRLDDARVELFRSQLLCWDFRALCDPEQHVIELSNANS